MRRVVLLASGVTVALLVVGVALFAGVTPSVHAAFGATSSCTPTDQEYGGCTGPQGQTISFTSTNPSPVHIDDTYTPTATATSGLQVTITLDASSSGCSLSTGVVTFTAAGTCLVDANQPGNGVWAAARQEQQSITVEGTSIPSCTVSSSPPTGCLTFPSETLSGNNNVYPNSGWTLTLNAVFSFDSSQSGNFSSFPNDYATGGGSYVIRNASGTIVEQGTLTANNGSAGTSEGLATALYLNDSVLIGSCSAANRRNLAVDASTSHGAFMYVSGTGYTGSTPGYTSQSYVTTDSYGSFFLDPSPVTVGC